MSVRYAARAALLVAILSAALSALASAHGLLRSSSPKAGAVLSRPPAELRLTFTEAPERRFTRVRLLGPDGPVSLDTLQLRPGNVVVAGVLASIPQGEYRVEWQTAGADGHPVSGLFTFTIALGDSAIAAGPPATDEGSPPVPSHAVTAGHTTAMGAAGESDPFAPFAAILRWLTLLGAVAAIGVVAFRGTVLARVSLEVDREIRTEYLPDAARAAAMLGLAASGLIVLTSAARLVLQSLAVHGSERAFDSALLVPMVVDTNWGRGWLIQLAGAVVALGAFAGVRRVRDRAWYAAAVGVGAVAVGLALASHAAVVPRLSTLSVAANIVHTLAAAGWLGNLLAVFAVGLPLAWRLDRNDRWTVIRDIVNAFSPAALAFGGLAAATGIFMAWTHVGSVGALTGTDYGRILLLKVGLLSLTALTGAYNWLRVRPRLGDEVGARRLRRTAGAELSIAALVLAVTAVLVALPMPQQP